MPWPRYGSRSIVDGRQGGLVPALLRRSLLLLALDDLAALLGAVFLARLDPALALAAVLPGAAVACSRTGALALARVDAGAVDRVPAGLLIRAGQHGAA